MIVNITTLKNHLENHKISGNDAIAIMTVIRKQLEHDKRKGDFQWLNHFCNWCLHPKLNRRIISVDIINSFIRAFFQVKKFNFAEVTPSLEFKYESDRESINEYFDSIIGQFRTELKEFLNIYHINTEFIKTDENFILFFARVFYIVKNSPLEVPDIVYVRGKKNLQKIEEYNELCTSFYKKWIWSKGVYISPDFYPIRISISHSLDGSFGLSVKTKYGSSLEFNPITYHGGTFRVQHEAVNINFNRGNVLIDKGELEKAKTAFQQSINIWPTSEAYGNLSSVLSKLGDHDEALTAAEKAIELNPDDHIAWINKSQVVVEHTFPCKHLVFFLLILIFTFNI